MTLLLYRAGQWANLGRKYRKETELQIVFITITTTVIVIIIVIYYSPDVSLLLKENLKPNTFKKLKKNRAKCQNNR